MTEFFDWIVNFFQNIWDFLTDFFERTLMLITYIRLAAQLFIDLIAGMPSWLQSFGFITLTVSIIYIILGRQTGGQKQ